MTFKEFSKAMKNDPRLMDLLDRCHPECGPMSDEETQELIDRTNIIMKHEKENKNRE